MKKIKRKQIDFGGTENQYIKGNGELGELDDISVGDDSVGSGASLPDGYYFPNALQDLDGNWYGGVVIGNQVWLAENYRCTKFPDGTSIINGSAAANGGRELNSASIPYYYWKNNDPLTVDTYGLKYNFSAISAGERSTTVSGQMKGIAPVNWHIPSPEEYTTLLEYIKSKAEYNVTVKDGKYSTTVLAHPSSLGTQTLLNITEKEKEILNATGFGFKEYMLLTSELLMTIVGMSAQERVTVFYQGDSASDGKRYNTLIGTEMSSALPTGFGEYLRIISNFNPIQFRNWYVNQYGTMQHHLGEDDGTPDTLATLSIKTNGQTLETYDPASGENKVVNIVIPQSATDLGALPGSTKYAASLDLSINPSTFVMTGQLYDQDNNAMGEPQLIDLPLESVVVDGTYDSQTGNIILTLQNGNTIEFPVTALVNGLQNVQSDWNQTDSTKDDYIKNKPTIPTIPDIPTVRTMNHEQLTDSTLGDINIHDGFYFPNATKDADGNWYGAVVIGDQVWMGENLRTTRFSDGTPITNGSPSANNGTLNYSVTEPRYYVSDDDPDTIPVIGLEYNGKALLNGDTTSDAVPSGIQGIAPNGWHIPSMGEYDQLLNYVISQKRYLSDIEDEEQNPEEHLYVTNSLSCDDVWGISNNNEYYPIGDTDKRNATGFNWKTYRTTEGYLGFMLATTKFSIRDTNHIGETISVCYNESGAILNTNDGHNCGYDNSTNNGLHVRCVSDLTPIQFRNWYIAQYGSLQHHLPEDNFGDNIYDGYYFPNATQDADGNWYGATVIGDQVWLGENFRCTSLPDGTPIANGSASTNNDVELFSPIIPYYYWVGDDSDNTEEYGLKYNFSAITNGESLGNNGIGVKGISPEGWHVPCVDEYDKLLSYISQKENYVELWHGYIRTPVLAKVDFLSSTYYNSLSYNLKQLVNATGFSLNVAALGTCELQAPATTNSEAIRALVWFNANNYFRLIYKNADPGSTDGSGLPLRLLSDMTPIQFRNWYVETYGTMQHHIVQIPNSDSEKEVIITRQGSTRYVCNKTSLDFYNMWLKGIKPTFYITNPSNTYYLGPCIASEGVLRFNNDNLEVSYDLYCHNSEIYYDRYEVTFLGTPSASEPVDVYHEKFRYYTHPENRTINGEPIFEQSLVGKGDIKLYDGYYFPNAISDYDCNWYGAVIIGDKVWLAENLRTTHYTNGTEITALEGQSYQNTSPAYSNEESSNIPLKYRGYKYNAITCNGANSTLLLDNWHVPSMTEYNELIDYIYKQNRYCENRIAKLVARSLMSANYWTNPHPHADSGVAINATGFNAYPTGRSKGNGQEGLSCSFLTSTSGFSFSYPGSNSQYTENGFGGYDWAFAIYASNIRCVSNLTPLQFRDWYVNTYGSMQHHLKDEILQSDWNQDDNTKQDYIKNKPELPLVIEFTSTNNYSTINNENLSCNKTAVEILEAILDKDSIIYKLNFANGDYVTLTEASETFNTETQSSLTRYTITKRLFSQNPHSESYIEVLLHIYIDKNTSTNEYTVNTFYAIATYNTTTQVTVNNGSLNVTVNSQSLLSFGANQSNNTALDFTQGAGITLEKDTTNNSIVISSESNHRVTSKDLILMSQNNSTLYKYNVLCELNYVQMSLVDLHDFSPNISGNFYNNDNVYVWTKAANETGKYIGLCHARSSDAKFVGKLTINDSINNEVISYYMGIIVDTPPDTTFTFVTNCSWDVIARLDTTPQTTNYNIYAYVKIPDNFVGTISFTPLRRTITSPPNPSNVQVGCFDYAAGTTTVQDYFWKDAVTGGTQNLDTVDVLLLDSPAPGTAGITTPFGKYQCNIIGDFGGTIAVNSKISDFVVNDFYLHSLEERVRSITSLYSLLPNLPTPTVADSGKVLTVDSSGNYVLQLKPSSSISSN